MTRSTRTLIPSPPWVVAAAWLAAGCSGYIGPSEGTQKTPPTPAGMTDSLGTALGPITSRIARDTASMATNLHLLARVEVQRNEMIEFYEPSAGSILISVAGAPAGRSTMRSLADLPAEEAWRQVAGGTPMPEALAQAVARVKDAAPAVGSLSRSLQVQEKGPSRGNPDGEPGAEAEPAPEAEPPPARPEVTGESSPAQAEDPPGWCDDTHEGYFAVGSFICPFRTAYYVACENNLSGNRRETTYAGRTVRAQVCPATGDVVLRMQALDYGPQPFLGVNGIGLPFRGEEVLVPRNTVRQFVWHDLPDDGKTLTADVLHAEGVRFHWIFAVWLVRPFSVYE